MTRRLHRCLTCQPGERPRRGYTRHRTPVCARCRAEGVDVMPGQVTITIKPVIPSITARSARVVFLPRIADPARPTVAEIQGGIDIGRFLA